MTSAEIRQSFLDFFAKQQHTVVPSASLLPDSPGLLFTNAGMNPFVPIFLGDKQPDVASWAGAIPGSDTRATDTQKCIRAGGKHNDLEDVGYDTYHHTLFEMLGNWSFGDYFKTESLTWGWELLTKVWGIPPKRLFATVYSPDKAKGDPADFDQEAYDIWKKLFEAAGLDPAIHIVNGNKKDNFWMMGDTGPCGPCSEIHFNLNVSDDEAAGRKLVNDSSPRCIEIWNHVFIQFNANADGTFSPLAAKHVDTGMGFERVAGIYATSKGFTDFTAEPSNYEADVFAPLFAKVAQLSGKTYTKTVPSKRDGLSEQENTDIAFRVLADHARTISCAIADGILPGNEGRNYVIRRILRRGILYGAKLGLQTGFFEQLVTPVVESLGAVFPELVQQQEIIRRVIRSEEESFGRTIEKGLNMFNKRAEAKAEIVRIAKELHSSSFFKLTREDIDSIPDAYEAAVSAIQRIHSRLEKLLVGKKQSGIIYQLIGLSAAGSLDHTSTPADYLPAIELMNLMTLAEKFITSTDNNKKAAFDQFVEKANRHILSAEKEFIDLRLKHKDTELDGAFVFTLYDTFGFPLDMTQLLATERGLTVDTDGFEKNMEAQRNRGRASTKKEIVVAATEGDETVTAAPTPFIGYVIGKSQSYSVKITDIITAERGTFLVFDQTPFYAEMGGQVGDCGVILDDGITVQISDTIKDRSGRYLHQVSNLKGHELPAAPRGSLSVTDGFLKSLIGRTVEAGVNMNHRRAIQRHHTATHLLHFALRRVLGTHVRQAGSLNAPDRMRFDFAHFEAVTPDQLHEIEHIVNWRILDNAEVKGYETDFDAKPKGTLAFFGEKYGKRVRVVDIGGYSRELCGGTHVNTTGEIGLFKIISENGISAGTRRIEAVCGQAAYDHVAKVEHKLAEAAAKVGVPVSQFDQKLESLLAEKAEMTRKLKSFEQKAAAGLADELAAKATEKDGLKFVAAVVQVENPADLRQIGAQVLAKLGEGVVKLGAAFDDKTSLVVHCSPAAIKAGHLAGKIVQNLTAQLGGKGGGKPDFAMGGGKEPEKLAEVLAS